MKMIEEKEA